MKLTETLSARNTGIDVSAWNVSTVGDLASPEGVSEFSLLTCKLCSRPALATSALQLGRGTTEWRSKFPEIVG